MFAQESLMDIQNIVTEQDTETLDAEIAAMTAAFTEEHYLNNDEAEHLEMIAAKSMVLGELYERAKWQAKAQAVPEGFVLVDKHQLAQLMANMDSFGKKALGDDYVSFADIAEVLDEAREPAND